MNIIPSTFVGAFAEGDILQVLVIAVLFGAALRLVGERGKPVAHLIEVTTDSCSRSSASSSGWRRSASSAPSPTPSGATASARCSSSATSSCSTMSRSLSSSSASSG